MSETNGSYRDKPKKRQVGIATTVSVETRRYYQSMAKAEGILITEYLRQKLDEKWPNAPGLPSKQLNSPGDGGGP